MLQSHWKCVCNCKDGKLLLHPQFLSPKANKSDVYSLFHAVFYLHYCALQIQLDKPVRKIHQKMFHDHLRLRITIKSIKKSEKMIMWSSNSGRKMKDLIVFGAWDQWKKEEEETCCGNDDVHCHSVLTKRNLIMWWYL